MQLIKRSLKINFGSLRHLLLPRPPSQSLSVVKSHGRGTFFPAAICLAHARPYSQPSVLLLEEVLGVSGKKEYVKPDSSRPPMAFLSIRPTILDLAGKQDSRAAVACPRNEPVNLLLNEQPCH